MGLILATAFFGWLLYKDGPTATPKAPVTAAASAAKPADAKLEAAAPAAKPAAAPAPVEAPKAAAPKAEAPKIEPQKPETKAEIKPAEATAPVAVAALPAGTTTFFGLSPSPAEVPARFNPDYKPAAVAVAAAEPSAPAVKAEAARPVVAPTPGVTSFYGITPSQVEASAVANPDYKPAAPIVVAVAPAPAAAVEAPKPAPVPTIGVTSFYGITPPVAEAPAVSNPNYKPAAPIVVAAAAPAVVEVAKPTPGVTSFYGVTPPVEEAPAVLNPNYKPAAPIVVAAEPAVVEAAKPTPGVTSFYGVTPPVVEAPAIANPNYKLAAPVVAATPTAAKQVAAAPAKPVEIVSCQDSVTKAVKSGPILFENAKAALTQASTATLDSVAAAFKSCPEARLQVDGHTDSSGSEERNQTLSERRAEAVVEYLTSKGVVPGLLGSAGYGLTKPVAPNDTPANKALNRRIDFTVSKK